MNCPRCGGPLNPGQNPCPSCGQPLIWSAPPPVQVPPPLPAATVAPPVAAGGDRALEFLVPVNRSWVAILAGYLGLFAIILIPAPVALVAGILAIAHVHANPGRRGMGRAVFAIVMGFLFTAILVFVLIAMATL